MKSYKGRMIKPIPGFDGYYACEDGSIWSIKGGRLKILKSSLDGNGYYHVSLYNNGKSKNVLVHKAVLIAFYGFPSEDLQCLHGPEGKHNNSLGNLRWGTYRENREDMKRDGTHQIGAKNPSAKITEKTVLEIRKLKDKKNEKELSKLFNISITQISRIKRNVAWNHVKE